MADPIIETARPYDRDAIFHQNGPINPTFVSEAIRTVIRALPLDPAEQPAWSHRRMFSAMLGLAALNPRDEIEIMLGVQALSAYHAAAACWRIGMNHHKPNGDSTRHITTAATAARTFDTMLRAIERRQVKPLSVPIGRPPGQNWPMMNLTEIVGGLEDRCGNVEPAPEPRAPETSVVWTPQDVQAAETFLDNERVAAENAGLDIANTEGILPGGGMILTEDPTPQQQLYIGRRLGLMYRREYEENRRNGINQIPKIRGIRPGDLIP
jgi:hypothetical protein